MWMFLQLIKTILHCPVLLLCSMIQLLPLLIAAAHVVALISSITHPLLEVLGFLATFYCSFGPRTSRKIPVEPCPPVCFPLCSSSGSRKSSAYIAVHCDKFCSSRSNSLTVLSSAADERVPLLFSGWCRCGKYVTFLYSISFLLHFRDSSASLPIKRAPGRSIHSSDICTIFVLFSLH